MHYVNLQISFKSFKVSCFGFYFFYTFMFYWVCLPDLHMCVSWVAFEGKQFIARDSSPILSVWIVPFACLLSVSMRMFICYNICTEVHIQPF